ncbi:MAG: Sec-independent protein translocase TatA [Desulfococcus sp. 4484_241]|nr:MAG: Sec-independent protein translocase TatA [Desulfococcus sp. 4484_241]
MFGIGMPELVIILIIVLIVFGGRKLPEIGAGLGGAIGEFKKSVSRVARDDKGLQVKGEKQVEPDVLKQ